MFEHRALFNMLFAPKEQTLTLDVVGNISQRHRKSWLTTSGPVLGQDVGAERVTEAKTCFIITWKHK